MNDPYYRNRLQASKDVRKWHKKIRPLSEQIKSASRMLLGTIMTMFVVTTITFLYISMVQSAKGYELSELEKTYEALLMENRELQRELNEAKALTNLENTEMIQEMVSSETEKYDYVGDASDLASR